MPEIAKSNAASADALAALERFVTENDDLLLLEERIGRFNIFDALGIVRREVQHSNFLAWLLDPDGTHGQGDLFLRAVLMDMLKHARQSGYDVPISAIELDGGDLERFEVRREWNRVDLMLLDRAMKLVVAIENKVDSDEHSDQLNRYAQAIDREFAGWRCLNIFLTPSGDAPSRKGWIPYSYRRLRDVIARIRQSSIGSLGSDVGAFVGHYQNLLETRLMDDEKLFELCRRIYANHKRALDLIFEHGNVGVAGLLGPVANTVEDMPGKPWIFPNRTGRWFRCIPEEWTKIIPPVAEQVPNPHALLFYEVWHDAGRRVSVTLMVAPCSDRELRLRLVNHLRDDAQALGLKPNFKATLDSEWTRLVSLRPYRYADELDADEAVASTLKTLHDLMGRVGPVTESLRRFFATSKV